jgi:hypothetical protein
MPVTIATEQNTKGTLDLTYTLGVYILNTLRTWKDVSYAVHPDMQRHTGGFIFIGLGGFIATQLHMFHVLGSMIGMLLALRVGSYVTEAITLIGINDIIGNLLVIAENLVLVNNVGNLIVSSQFLEIDNS